MSDNIQADIKAEPQKPNLLISFLRAVIRLILSILLGGFLGLLAFLVYLNFSQQLLINNLSTEQKINELENHQAVTQKQIDERLSQYNKRLSALESQSGQNGQKLSEIESNILNIQKDDNSINRISKQINSLEESLKSLQAKFDQIKTPTPDNHSSKTYDELNALKKEIMLVKIMQFINRSRLYLLQNNYGLARKELDRAFLSLEPFSKDTPDNQKTFFFQLLTRLDMAKSNLPDFPIQAADDLEIVWSMLANITNNGEIAQTTPTPSDASPLVIPATPSATISLIPSLTATIQPESKLQITPIPQLVLTKSLSQTSVSP